VLATCRQEISRARDHDDAINAEQEQANQALSTVRWAIVGDPNLAQSYIVQTFHI
jgi:hypothetical protein